MMTVADYIADFLVKKGVRHIFGFQGSAMLKMLDAIVGTGKIEYIQNFNEQASSFCADAYARIKNDIGVAIATSGPGAVNLIGGIANAYFDSVPAFFITGQDYLSVLQSRGAARQNGFQDMDIVSMVQPVSKYAVTVQNPLDIRYELEKAYHLATSGRKGPVLIDVPVDIQFAQIDETKLRGFSALPQKTEEATEISEIIEALKNARRPVILAGGGIRQAGAAEDLKLFAQKTQIPVVATLNGIDAYDDILGFAGLYGNSEANLAILNADLLLVFGARFAVKHTGKKKELYNKAAKIVRVEIDDTEIDRTFIKNDICIKCDIKKFLQTITDRCFPVDCLPWRKQIEEWKSRYADTICLAPQYVCPVSLIRAISQRLQPQQIVTADVGANQMWTAQALRNKNGGRLLNSSGFGAMGYALPAAIGASALSRLPVIALTGDGGLQMNLQELNTLSLRRCNVKCFIFNNNNLGLMRDTQIRYYESHFYGNNAKEFSCPDIALLAQTYKLNYTSLNDNTEFEKLEQILSDGEPWLIDVKIDLNTAVLNRYDDKALHNG